MIETKDRISELFERVGETCPFKLANYLGVKIIHRSGLGEIAGLYIKTTPTTHRFFLNTNLDIYLQEKVCFELVSRRVSHPDMTYALTAADLKKPAKSNALDRLKNAILSKTADVGLYI